MKYREVTKFLNNNKYRLAGILLGSLGGAYLGRKLGDAPGLLAGALLGKFIGYNAGDALTRKIDDDTDIIVDI